MVSQGALGSCLSVEGREQLRNAPFVSLRPLDTHAQVLTYLCPHSWKGDIFSLTLGSAEHWRKQREITQAPQEDYGQSSNRAVGSVPEGQRRERRTFELCLIGCAIRQEHKQQSATYNPRTWMVEAGESRVQDKLD